MVVWVFLMSTIKINSKDTAFVTDASTNTGIYILIMRMMWDVAMRVRMV